MKGAYRLTRTLPPVPNRVYGGRLGRLDLEHTNGERKINKLVEWILLVFIGRPQGARAEP